jgi:hypothetical protein
VSKTFISYRLIAAYLIRERERDGKIPQIPGRAVEEELVRLFAVVVTDLLSLLPSRI